MGQSESHYELLKSLGKQVGYNSEWRYVRGGSGDENWPENEFYTDAPDVPAANWLVDALNQAISDQCCSCCQLLEWPGCMARGSPGFTHPRMLTSVHITQRDLDSVIQAYAQCPHGKEVVQMVRDLLSKPAYDVRQAANRLGGKPPLTETEKDVIRAAIRKRVSRTQSAM
jgi:hypothetical protein